MNTPVAISETTLRETVANFVSRDPKEIGATENFGDELGLDSIDRLDLLAAVEQRHGVYLRDEQISSIRNLDDLLQALNARTGGTKS